MTSLFSYWRRNPLLPESFVQTMMPLPAFLLNERIALVVPHPDDETLGCAGLIQKITAAALPFHIIMVSDGNRRGKKVRRKKEVLAAMAHCGVEPDQFSFLDFPDGGLTKSAVMPANLVRELSQFAPTTVIVTDSDDIHQDHAVLGRILLQEAPTLLSVQRVWAIMIHYHRFPRPIGHRPTAPLLPPAQLLLDSTPWFSFTLTPDQQHMKYTALREFKSQLHTPFLRGLMLSFDRPNELYRQIFTREDGLASTTGLKD